MTKSPYAQVVLGLPIDKSFTYSIPSELAESVQVGSRVQVPFGKRQMVGYVVGFKEKAEFKAIKSIKSILGTEPILDKQMLELTRKVADYYCASWGEVIDAAHPANVRKRKRALPEKSKLVVKEAHHASNWKEKLKLTVKQQEALDSIEKSIKAKKHQVFLLHGITASGKTEIYLQAIHEVLDQGRSAIVLVPEISLTPQTVDRFKARFGERIAVMHSRLLSHERAYQWKRIKENQAQIVIGARSAIFAPVSNLGLIVIDEEHETTYKQSEPAPRYHAREVAVIRAEMSDAAVILGSATPSLESFYLAKQGKIKLLSLPERVTKRDLPEVSIIDMKEEGASRKKRVNILSRVLEFKIRDVLNRKEQTILFLNRRGFATYINCLSCGYVAKCKRCNVSLTYHYSRKTLICHYCNFSVTPPKLCPQCNSDYLRFFGIGTEKVESELYRLFPQARIARMDTDVTTERDAHDKILTAFRQHKIDILVGTQMIAKGLDFPKVSLVGVISADTALNLPDFRSGERTFNLLTQVGGRAGRGETEGKVVIQTYVPEHYAIDASINHDYHQFYRHEIKSREELELPPFTHLINVILRGRDEEKVRNTALELSLDFKKKKVAEDIQILGPAPAAISRIRGSFYWNILLKGYKIEELLKTVKNTVKDFKKYKGAVLAVDVDPF